VRIQRRQINTPPPSNSSSAVGPSTPRHAEHWHIPHKNATNMGRTTALLDGCFTVCVVSSPNDNQRNPCYTGGNDRPTLIVAGSSGAGGRPQVGNIPERSHESIRSCFSHRSVLPCGARTHERKRRRAVNMLWAIGFLSIRLSPSMELRKYPVQCQDKLQQQLMWEAKSGRRSLASCDLHTYHKS
jgi:hypothetical protein